MCSYSFDICDILEMRICIDYIIECSRNKKKTERSLNFIHVVRRLQIYYLSSSQPSWLAYDGNFRRHSSMYVAIVLHDGNFRQFYYISTSTPGS